jgi:hypothetical protein
MKTIIFLFLLISTVYASEYNINSDSIDLRKNTLLLENVNFDHPLGKIKAKKAIANNITNHEQKSFSEIILEENVFFTFSNDNEIHADKAIYKKDTSEIIFLSQNNPITYITYRIHNEKKLPIVIKSNLINIKINSSIKPSLKLKNVFSISLENNVNITCDNSCTLQASKVFIENANDNAAFIAYLSSHDNHLCKLTKDNDVIDFVSGKLEFNNLNVLLEKANGKLLLDPKENIFFNFSSDKLKWQNSSNRIVLKNNVSLNHENKISLQTDKIEIFQSNKDFKNTIQKIQAIGKTSFFLKNAYSIELTCQGIIKLDNYKKTIFIKDTDTKQIFIKGNYFHVLTDSCQINYLLEGSNITPLDITLKDNVKFAITKFSNKKNYGFADKLIYLPNEKKITLSSKKNNKVYFYQEHDSLKLTANKIEILQDSNYNQTSIKGIGLVRFTYDFKEQEFLHNLFSQHLGEK